MNSQSPHQAMVLAAGLGLRMRPLTNNLPKPLVLLNGKSLLDRVLDHLIEIGVKNVTINLHYLGEMIENHLKTRVNPEINFSNEAECLLETGGGVAKALKFFEANPFYVINSDIAWKNGKIPALKRLVEFWDDGLMDALLLLHPVSGTNGYNGNGDYNRMKNGRLRRRINETGVPFVFTGIQILHPRLFARAPAGPFSLTSLYNEAEGNNRLFGIIHDGEWYHLGSIVALREVEKISKGL